MGAITDLLRKEKHNMANVTGPFFTITIYPVSGGEWEIVFHSNVRAFGSTDYLNIESFPNLAPHYYFGGPGFGTRVKDDGNPSGMMGVPTGVGSFARAVKNAGGLLFVQPFEFEPPE